MSPVMEELVAFLRARIDEDEASARAATAGRWYAQDGGVTTDEEEWPVSGVETKRERADRVHIARWDPRRVLAECAMKRVLVDRAVANEERWGPDWDPDYDGYLLPALAAVYSGHPDFRAEWVT